MPGRRDKVRARISDPRLQEKFAPKVKPHAFGCKRPSLENGFYELFERPNVHLVDMKETPIVEVTPTGIRTTEEALDFDVVVCATGFDAVTGGLLQINAHGKDGVQLADKWKDGVKTLMGLCVSGFPNMSVELSELLRVYVLTFMAVGFSPTGRKHLLLSATDRLAPSCRASGLCRL